MTPDVLVRVLRSAPVSLVLLGAAAVGSLGAWGLEASASADMARAREVQAKETADSDSRPPSASDNRRIIASLDEATEVRRQIDEQLQRIEASVATLVASQKGAGRVSDRALSEVKRIAGALGGAETAARSATDRLGDLRSKLRAAARLADLIADELEELDRRLGPSAGGRP